jgi:multicomponent Na+:H+ antiporter subunit E
LSTPDAIERTRWSNLRDDTGVAAVLVVVWTLLWGEMSISNVASGVVVAVALLVAFPIDHNVTAVVHRPRPLAIVRLVLFFAYDVVRSTFVAALHVVRPGSSIRTGVIACPLRVDNDGLVTVLANLIAMSPGTMPIEVSYNPHVIYVHSLHAGDPDRVRADVAQLEELAVAALGGPEAL